MDKKVVIIGLLLFTVPILLTPSKPLVLRHIPHNGIIQSQTKLLNKTSVQPRFEDATLISGIHFAHRQGDEKLTGLDEVLGSGVCAFDYDNDGWVDLFLVNGTGESRYYGKEHWWQENIGHQLYRNTGNALFEKTTKQAQLNTHSWGMGCASADLDNDGDQDFVITNIGANQLYRNNGNGRFSDVTAQSGITGDHWSTSVAIDDFNRDGLPDIYITNYIRYKKGAFTYEKQNAFNNIGTQLTFDSTLYDAEENKLYLNQGGLSFRDVSHEYGVANAGGRSLDAAWVDVNSDHYPDLYIVNDKGIGSNTLYLNQEGKTFVEASTDAKAGSAGNHTAIANGDIDNDGDQDILLSSRITKTHNLLINKTKLPRDGVTTLPVFSDEARPRGIGSEQSSGKTGWGSGIHDFNNDGWQDIFVANGLLVPEKESPRVTVGQKNELWLNNGGTFTQGVAAPGTPLGDREPSRGVAVADFDNNGSMDLFITSNNGMGQLLLNRSSGNWLSLRLRGDNKNRDALGSRVKLTTAGGSQYRTTGNRSSYLSNSEERLHFGLGEHRTIESLEVTWYDGSRSTFEKVEANRHLVLEKGSQKLLQENPAKEDSVTRPKLNLVTGQERSENRADYVGWLPHFLKPEDALNELRAALVDKNDIVRLEAIKALRKLNHPKALTLTIEALADPSPAVSQAALEASCAYEDEYAIRWLLREFYSPKTQHRKGVAECFEFYFREEEAVVHRKWLVIPHLIALLADSEDEVVMAAINALAEAENYRAVSPLIDLVRARERDEAILLNAIRAIGLIREKSAYDFIVNELNVQSNHPDLRAQLMIALKRLEPSLGYEKIEQQVFSSSLAEGVEKERVVHNVLILLSLVEYLKSDPVFSAERVFQSLNTVYKNNSRLLVLEEALQVRYLRALAMYPGQASHLIKYLDDHHPKLRQISFVGLISNASEKSGNYIKMAFADPSIEVRHAIVALLNSRKTPISEVLYLTLLSDKTSRKHALQLEYVEPGREALRLLLSIAADREQPISERVAALSVMQRSHQPKIALPRSLAESDNTKIKAQALLYINAQSTPYPEKGVIPKIYRDALQSEELSIVRASFLVLAQSNKQWARDIVTEFIQQRGKPLRMRKLALTATSQFSELPHNAQLLANVAMDPIDPLNRVALRLLAETKQLYRYKELTTTVQNDSDRFIVAKSLIEKGQSEAFFMLRDSATRPRGNDGN